MKKLVVFGAVVAVAGMVLAAPASANHSWGKYHWARTANPFSLTLGDNTSSDRAVNWSSMLSTVSSAWNNPNHLGPSTVLHTTVGTGDAGRDCGAVLGKVEVCSADYGNNGWLGQAQIWLYRGGGHIAQGTVQLNDYYYKSSSGYQYNNAADQLHTICQEVGHTFGLDHQSTSGASLDTCMDYYHNTSSSDTKSTLPNAGDFGELSCIYDPAFRRQTISSTVSTAYASYTHTCRGTGHLDSFDSAGAGATAGSRSSYFPHAKPSFAPGTKVAKDEYVDQLPNGGKLVTFVTPPNG